MALFLISISEDGDIYIKQVDRAKFLDDLNDGDYEGERFYSELPTQFRRVPGGDNEGEQLYSESPAETSVEYWPSGYIIIEGEIIVPKPKEVVTKYEF